MIAQQPEEDTEDYIEMGRVALEQKWTINDLRQMSKPDGALYTLAVDRFKLKDGIVRHLAEDIRKFKPVYRTASSLASMGADVTNLGGGDI